MSEKNYVINEFYDKVLFPKLYRKHVGKFRSTPEMIALRAKVAKLTQQEKLAYISQLIQQEKSAEESRRIIRDGTKGSHKNGPLTVDVYSLDGKTLVSGDCTECKQFPCAHSGANFTNNGLLKGIFPKEVLSK